MKNISVFLIDDHIMVLEGLKAVLNNTPDISVSGIATSVEDALNSKEMSHAEILILDNRLNGQSGIDSCALIKQHHPKLLIIILTSFMETDMVLKAIQSGVNGYLLKELDTDQLCDNIRLVASGGTAMPSDQAIKLSDLLELSQNTPRIADSFENTLSPQEIKISALVCEGLINKEIADRLDLSEQTVKNYLTQIYSKLNISRRSQLAVIFTKNLKIRED